MKRKLLTIIVVCALTLSATACSTSKEKTTINESTNQKTPIEEAVESTRTAAEEAELLRATNTPAEASETPVVLPEITDSAEEDFDIITEESVETITETVDTEQSVITTAEIVSTEQTVATTAEIISTEQTVTTTTETTEPFILTPPEGFTEYMEGMYTGPNSNKDASCIIWFSTPNDGSFDDANSDMIMSAFKSELSEYNEEGKTLELLEEESFEVDGHDGYMIALRYSEQGIGLIELMSIIETPDTLYFIMCTEVEGTGYYESYKECIKSIRFK